MKRFVNLFTCFLFIMLFMGMSVGNAFAWSSGPIDGRTGAPADGGDTCNSTGCHNDFTTNSGTADFSISAPSDYTLGADSTITVSFSSTNSSRHGFELSANDADGNNVGTFTASDSNNTQVSGDGDFIKHTTSGNSSSSWSVTWTAPSSSVTDPVTFYAAGNQTDSNGSPTGDYIYTATASVSAAGASVDPVPVIQANGLGGSITIAEGENLTLKVSLDPGSYTGAADWWVIEETSSGTRYFNTSGSFVSDVTPGLQSVLFDLDSYEVYSTSSLAADTYTYSFAIDTNKNGELDQGDDVFFVDSVTVKVSGGVSFEDDILPLFSATDGAGAWFNYNSGRDDDNTFYKTACGACHAGEVTDDGIEGDGSDCRPECHLMDLNTHAGWLAGADDGDEPLLGESSVGDTDYDWKHSKLRSRLRNNRMPPGVPFYIDEMSRNGGDIALTADCDANDIDLGRQFCVQVEGEAGRGEVQYEGEFNAVDLLGAYVDGLSGSPIAYAGSAGPVNFADIAGLFTQPNVFYNGGLSCTNCHYCDEEPPCFHMIDFNTQAGLLLGADGGDEPLLGESEVGAIDYDWSGSGLRARLRNNRMPPNAPFELFELGRMGPMMTHPITGAQITAVDLIGEWVTGPDGIPGTEDDAMDN